MSWHAVAKAPAVHVAELVVPREIVLFPLLPVTTMVGNSSFLGMQQLSIPKSYLSGSTIRVAFEARAPFPRLTRRGSAQALAANVPPLPLTSHFQETDLPSTFQAPCGRKGHFLDLIAGWLFGTIFGCSTLRCFSRFDPVWLAGFWGKANEQVLVIIALPQNSEHLQPKGLHAPVGMDGMDSFMFGVHCCSGFVFPRKWLGQFLERPTSAPNHCILHSTVMLCDKKSIFPLAETQQLTG